MNGIRRIVTFEFIVTMSGNTLQSFGLGGL